MNTTTELASLPPKETALAVYTAPAGIDPYLQQIRQEIDAFEPDVSTKKGRDAIASIAHKVARSKVALDNIGKQLVDELKDVPRKIDAERKRMRDLLDQWKDDVRRPLTEWEGAEEARVVAHKNAVQGLNSHALGLGDLTAAQIRARIEVLNGTAVGPQWEEFEAEAHRVKAQTLETMSEALAAREKHEAEQAELARLRAEAAERAQREAEAKAQAEREAITRREQEAKAAAERRELELKLAAERAEREKAEALRREQEAKAEAERKAAEAVEAEKRRVAALAAAEAAEAKRREADKQHKAQINRAAVQALVDGGVSEDCAKAVITLIAKKAIPAVSITY